MADFDQPTVKVHFPDGIKDWPAHLESELDLPSPRLHIREAAMPRYVPDSAEGWIFEENIDGDWIAIKTWKPDRET